MDLFSNIEIEIFILNDTYVCYFHNLRSISSSLSLKLNLHLKGALVLQNSQRRESFLYKSGSEYDVQSPRWDLEDS